MLSWLALVAAVVAYAFSLGSGSTVSTLVANTHRADGERPMGSASEARSLPASDPEIGSKAQGLDRPLDRATDDRGTGESSAFVEDLHLGPIEQATLVDWLLWTTTLVSAESSASNVVTLDVRDVPAWTSGQILKHPQSGSRGPRLEWKLDGRLRLAPSDEKTPLKLQVVVGFEDSTCQQVEMMNVIVQQDYPYTHAWRDLLEEEQVTGANMSWKKDESTWFAILSSSSRTTTDTEFVQRFGEPRSKPSKLEHLPAHLVLADFSASL